MSSLSERRGSAVPGIYEYEEVFSRMGRSAFDTEAIYNLISSIRTSSHGASVQSCISAIDIALWDIVGQHLKVPVYRLLGGKVNRRVKIYASYRWGNIPRTRDAYAARTKELIQQGALAGKWDPFFSGDSLRGVNELVAMVAGIREGRPEFEICVEGHGRFNVAGAGKTGAGHPNFRRVPSGPRCGHRGSGTCAAGSLHVLGTSASCGAQF